MLTGRSARPADGRWGVEDRMTESETLAWRSERHPQRSSTVSVLMTLDRVPDRDRLRAVHDRATRLVPRARKRVQEPAVPVGPPAWVVDPAFDLDYHLRRVSVPAPGGLAQVLAFAQGAAMAPFDRTRPLWEGTLIEGLPDGKAGYLLKLHRSLAEGLISVRPRRLPAIHGHLPVASQGLNESLSAAWRLAIGELAEQVLVLPSATAKAVAAGAKALAHPSSVATGALWFAGSLRRITTPAVPVSPLFRGRTGKSWRFGVVECPLAALRAAAAAAGGSVDDAYVAALLGGMRRYHERCGVDLDEMSMTMPVSLPRSAEPDGGDERVGATFAAPAGIEDPTERVAAIHGIGLSLRMEPALDSLPTLRSVLNRVPAAVRTAAGRLSAATDMVASVFPSAPAGACLAGAKVERAYLFGPLPGVVVTASMVPQAGVCCVGLNIDGSVVPDPEMLIECMREGFREVLEPARRTGSR